VVRVTASEVVGVEVLPPILAALRARHPGLTVELALSNRLQDLLQREADIAVRMQAPQQGRCWPGGSGPSTWACTPIRTTWPGTARRRTGPTWRGTA
jgi:DNA-binding transcriptional LysR family regulator